MDEQGVGLLSGKKSTTCSFANFFRCKPDGDDWLLPQPAAMSHNTTRNAWRSACYGCSISAMYVTVSAVAWWLFDCHDSAGVCQQQPEFYHFIGAQCIIGVVILALQYCMDNRRLDHERMCIEKAVAIIRACNLYHQASHAQDSVLVAGVTVVQLVGEYVALQKQSHYYCCNSHYCTFSWFDIGSKVSVYSVYFLYSVLANYLIRMVSIKVYGDILDQNIDALQLNLLNWLLIGTSSALMAVLRVKGDAIHNSRMTVLWQVNMTLSQLIVTAAPADDNIAAIEDRMTANPDIFNLTDKRRKSLIHKV